MKISENYYGLILSSTILYKIIVVKCTLESFQTAQHIETAEYIPPIGGKEKFVNN